MIANVYTPIPSLGFREDWRAAMFCNKAIVYSIMYNYAYLKVEQYQWQLSTGGRILTGAGAGRPLISGD